jgi:hypothetical protein
MPNALVVGFNNFPARHSSSRCRELTVMVASPGRIEIVNKRAKSLAGLGGPGSRLILLCLLTMGCFSGPRKPPNEKPVTPVTGLVLVDGAPVAGIQVRFIAATQDPQNATLSVAKTDAEGRFKAMTYRVDDGVPPGDYAVTFNDQSEAKPHMRSSPDLFKGRYSDPQKSDFKLAVPADAKPIDMGTIELTRSGKK